MSFEQFHMAVTLMEHPHNILVLTLSCHNVLRWEVLTETNCTFLLLIY